jgi:hypothetical protein
MSCIFTYKVEAYPSEQWKQSIEKKQKMELKHKLVGLAVLATTMYMFRDDLNEFSFKHNKIAYGSMIFGISEIFGWKIALGFLIGREVTQLETWPELLGDSVTDAIAGLIGIGVSIKL